MEVTEVQNIVIVDRRHLITEEDVTTDLDLDRILHVSVTFFLIVLLLS